MGREMREGQNEGGRTGRGRSMDAECTESCSDGPTGQQTDGQNISK